MFGSATAEEVDVDNLSLADLLDNTQLTVASSKATNARRSPGIVTLITSEDMRKLGARDLLDVLYMVPGFTVNADIYHTDGLSVRGIYAIEGRTLFIIDGIMMNDLAYGNFSFAHRYPIDQIDRIEIIRGPGSAIYGGFAELAVIKVTTKGAAGKKGIEVGAQYGQMTRGYARRDVTARMATKNVDAAVYIEQGRRSDQSSQLQDTGIPSVVDYDLIDTTETRPFYANVGVHGGDFEARFIMDKFEMENRQAYGYLILPYAFKTTFLSYNFQLKYRWKPRSDLTITPTYTFRHDESWKVKEDWTRTSSEVYFNSPIRRHTAQVKSVWQPKESFNLTAGAEYMSEVAETIPPSDQFLITRIGGRHLAFASVAAFSEALLETELANFTVGVRWEDHSAFDNAFVPRFAATRTFGDFHLKGLFSKAYRNPSVQNINTFDYSSGSLRPEEATTYEIEAGYQLSSSQAITANVFDTTIDHPLIYVSNADKYQASDRLATRGFELEYRLKGEWGSGAINYSHYSVLANDTSTIVNSDGRQTLGNSPDKITALANYRITSELTLTPSIIYLSPAYSATYNPATLDDFNYETATEAYYLLNLNFAVENLGGIKGLGGSLGVFNILNQHHVYHVAYHSEADDLPAPSREIVGRIGYSVSY